MSTKPNIDDEAAHYQVVPLIEELGIEGAIVPNRRGELYRLAAAEIDRLSRELAEQKGALSDGNAARWREYGGRLQRAMLEIEERTRPNGDMADLPVNALAKMALLDRPESESEIGTGNPKPVGRCATTQTERYRVEGCTCPTYPGNEGLPCLTWCQSRAADRCAYCDHNLECHRRLSAMFKGSHAVGILQCSVCGALGTPSCSREGCPARNDALDAMRYRWIRNRWDDWSGLTWARPIPPKLDAAIDEAMQGCHSQVRLEKEADRG